MKSAEHNPKSGSAANVLRLTDELEELLGRYLDTMPERDADEALAEFTSPRSAQIDELLRRSHLDGDIAVLAELERSLRAYFVAPEPGDRSAQVASPEHVKWRKRTASDIHRMVRVADRARSYAELVALEEEQTHTFDDAHESTIKGMAPPNARPIGVDTKHQQPRGR